MKRKSRIYVRFCSLDRDDLKVFFEALWSQKRGWIKDVFGKYFAYRVWCDPFVRVAVDFMLKQYKGDYDLWIEILIEEKTNNIFLRMHTDDSSPMSGNWMSRFQMLTQDKSDLMLFNENFVVKDS